MGITTNNPQAELPKYLCHKRVWALKVGKITVQDIEDDGTTTLHPIDEKYAPFTVDKDFMNRHKPDKEGGYFVVYEDGYKSFSPTKAFEDGYELIK